MKTEFSPTEIKEELENAAVLIEGMLGYSRYNDYEIEEIHSTIRGIYGAINIIDLHIKRLNNS
jgi:hypothetical protein